MHSEGATTMQNEDRIYVLENQVRNLKRYFIGFCCLVFTGITIATTSMSQVQDSIKAKQFIVMDDDGNQVAMLGTGKHGGGSVLLHNTKGKMLVSVTEDKNGNANLLLSNRNDSAMVEMKSDQYGRARVHVNDQNGKKQILLSSNSVGANLKMYNPGGGQLAALGGNMTANGSFWLWRESDGMPLCTILSSGDGAGKVAVYDTDGMIDSVPSSDPSTEKKDNDEQD